MATEGITLDRVHRMGLDQYHRLIESGGFDDNARIELIDGLLVDMSPKTREHEQAIMWLSRWLMDYADRERFMVGIHSALTLECSEPEPDLLVFRIDSPRPYHPGTAELVIEVAVSSLRHDLVIKHRVYAQAGVAEYWVVDVDGGRIVRHRNPSPQGYGRVEELHDGDVLAGAVADLPPLDTRVLFEAAAQ